MPSFAMKVNRMTDEKTNPATSPAASIPGRPSNRNVLLALTVSLNHVAFWGSLLYWHWKSDSVQMAVGRCAVFVAVMAGVHFIGYRLWQRQCVQDQGDSNESPSSPDFARVLAPYQNCTTSAWRHLVSGVGRPADCSRRPDCRLGLLAGLRRHRSPPTKFTNAGRYPFDSIWFLVDFRRRIRRRAVFLGSVGPHVNPTMHHNSMKTFEELLNLQEPGWAVVQGWLREATNTVEVLPPIEANRKSALVAIQVTTRSPMGEIIYEAGGILVDHGWIRILGFGLRTPAAISARMEQRPHF